MASDGSVKAETIDKNGEKITVNIDGAGGKTEQYQTNIEQVKEKVFPPFDSSTFGPQLFWLALTFGILYLLMSKIALPRIGEILEVRRDRIEGDLAEAERLRQKSEKALENYQKELANAKEKAHEIAEKTRADIKSELDEKHAQVEADLSKKLGAAEARIKQTKEDALANIEDIASDTLVEIMSKLNSKISAKEARKAVGSILKE